MDLHWIKMSSSLGKGVAIINQLEDTRFEQFLRRIVTKLKLQVTEIFSDDERQKLGTIFKMDQENLLFAIKTIIYVFKRLLKYIFMPLDLKNELKTIGFNNEKADSIVKVWSAETRSTLNELGLQVIDKSRDTINFSWKLNAELSSDYCKKSKIPKAYISLAGEQETEIELTHSELYSMFIQFESIQNDIDNFT